MSLLHDRVAAINRLLETKEHDVSAPQCPIILMEKDGPVQCSFPDLHGGRHSFQIEDEDVKRERREALEQAMQEVGEEIRRRQGSPYEEALQEALSALDATEDALLDAARGHDVVELAEVLRTNHERRDQILSVLANHGETCRPIDVRMREVPEGPQCPHPQIGKPPHCGRALCPYEHGTDEDSSAEREKAQACIAEVDRLSSWLLENTPGPGSSALDGSYPGSESAVDLAIRLLDECGFGRVSESAGWTVVPAGGALYRVAAAAYVQIRAEARADGE